MGSCGIPTGLCKFYVQVAFLVGDPVGDECHPSPFSIYIGISAATTHSPISTFKEFWGEHPSYPSASPLGGGGGGPVEECHLLRERLFCRHASRYKQRP